MTQVTGIQCPKCKYIIFSRAHHDYHACKCGCVTIDGGFDYIHYGWNPSVERPEPISFLVALSKQELYDDWNKMTDQYGWLPEDYFFMNEQIVAERLYG